MTYLLYKGKNKGTLPGVPAKDLSYAEAKQYDIVKLIQSGLYVFDYEDSIPKETKEALGMVKKEEPQPDERPAKVETLEKKSVKKTRRVKHE